MSKLHHSPVSSLNEPARPASIFSDPWTPGYRHASLSGTVEIGMNFEH